jgi:hypothetical protein
MSEKKSFEITEEGTTPHEIVPYLRLTVSGTTYTLNILVTVPYNYTIGDCSVSHSDSAVKVDIPVTGSGSSGPWKAVSTSCTLPDASDTITENSIITVNINDGSSVTDEDGGGDPPIAKGSSKVTYEDAEEE